MEIKTNVHISFNMNDLARSSVRAFDMVASSVGNKYSPMGWEEVWFISDEKNVPVQLGEIVGFFEIVLRDGPDEEEEDHERTHCEEEDTGAAEEEGNEWYYEEDKKDSLCHYERTMKNDFLVRWMQLIL